jgi:xanthine dehydrogenase accessory factor
VTESGKVLGSVSGGCVESDVVEQAKEVIAGGKPRLLTYGITDDQAWEIGLPCGGEIDIFVGLSALPGWGALEASTLVTVLEGPRVGEQWYVEDDVIEGPSRVLEFQGEKVFAEIPAAPPRLVVIGATDTADALCRAAHAIGWRTVVVDPRPGLVNRERLPSPDELVTAWPDEGLEKLQLRNDDAVVVLTHEERLDVPALTTALPSDAFYVGAIGSRKTQAKRHERLLEAGLSEEAIDRLSGPAGLDLGAEWPAETALSILAEVLAVRAGRSGGRLVERSGPIHSTA